MKKILFKYGYNLSHTVHQYTTYSPVAPFTNSMGK